MTSSGTRGEKTFSNTCKDDVLTHDSRLAHCPRAEFTVKVAVGPTTEWMWQGLMRSTSTSEIERERVRSRMSTPGTRVLTFDSIAADGTRVLTCDRIPTL